MSVVITALIFLDRSADESARAGADGRADCRALAHRPVAAATNDRAGGRADARALPGGCFTRGECEGAKALPTPQLLN